MNAPQQKPAADAPERDSPPVRPTSDGQAPDVAGTTPREIGGRDGPEPTRYGDWEKAGRCIDF
jgi:hypothetical protein